MKQHLQEGHINKGSLPKSGVTRNAHKHVSTSNGFNCNWLWQMLDQLGGCPVNMSSVMYEMNNCWIPF